MTRPLRRNCSLTLIAAFEVLSFFGAPLAQAQARANQQSPTPSASVRLKAGVGPLSSSLFQPVVTYDSGGEQAAMVVVADVNGDGKPDLIVLNCGNCYGPSSITNPGSVAVMLGNGDGTFQKAVTYGTGTASPRFVAVADVNGDGKPDLVVANRCLDNRCLVGAVAVLLGNGDGTFQAAVTYNSGGLFTSSVAVGDLNGDGKPDLVVGNGCADSSCDGSVGVLLGNGDGTFQPVVTYPTGGSYAFAVAVEDVNADGKPDVLVLTYVTGVNVNAVGVLLGNGDGTFQPAVTYRSGGTTVTPSSSLLAVADVNGDGKPDLLVENGQCCGTGNGTVGVLLGNGDGTFKPVVTYKSARGTDGSSIAVADVNSDGKLDVVATTWNVDNNGLNEGLVSLRLGNGDGTFQAEQTYSSGGFLTNSATIADLNGDGKPDLVVANICSDNTLYCKAANVGVLLNNFGSLSPTTTTLTSSLNPSFVGQAVIFTAAVTSTAGSPPNGEIVTFKNGSTVLGNGALTGGIASITTSSLPTGIFTITASYPGDSNFAASISPILKQVVNSTTKSATSTTFVSSLNPSIYGQRITLTAKVKTTGSVPPTGTVAFTRQYFTETYTIGSATLNSSGVATLAKSNLNAGSYPLTAVYKGDLNNLGSTSVAVNQVVVQTTSAAAITASPNPSTVGQAVTFTAKITSPTVTPTGPVNFTAGTTMLGMAQLSGGKATFTTSSLPAGSTAITATYAGDSNIAKSSAGVTQVVQP